MWNVVMDKRIMKKSKRIDEETPNGGAYSEIFFFDKDGNPVDEDKAERCIIRECTASGELVSETIGICN